jgi:hypothetical protein
MKTKKYGGEINDNWTQYGDVCVRQSTGNFLKGSGNWYFVVNTYIKDDKTFTFYPNNNKLIHSQPPTTLIMNETLRKENVIMQLNNSRILKKCEQNVGNDFGIINTEEVNRKFNINVPRYLTLILVRVNTMHKKMSNYIAQIKNVVDIDSYLPNTGSEMYKLKNYATKATKYMEQNPKFNLETDFDQLPTQVDIGPDSAGIHLGDLIIQQMSGPISTYYLRPKQNIYDSGEARFFPLILLFGDMHRSYANSCSPCDYTNLCYKISDPYLLKKIDNLSTSTHPIDFYTESRIEDTREGFKNGYMEELTTQNMVVCGNHTLKTTSPSEYAKKCPTKNIRWQGGDPRFSYDYSESFFSSLRTEILDLINITSTTRSSSLKNVKKIIKNHFKTIDDFKHFFNPLMYLKDTEITSQIKEATNALTESNKLMSELMEKTKSPDVDFEIARLKMSIIKNTQIKEQNERLYEDKCNKAYTEFTENIFSFLTKGNSLILKQIQKQNYAPFTTFDFWKKIFKLSLKTDFELFKIHSFIPTTLNYMYKLVYVDSDLKLPKPVDLASSYITLFLMNIDSSFMNMYAVARILKQPEEGIRASMSICYFGDLHIQSIVGLFDSIGYEVGFSYLSPKTKKFVANSRCQHYTTKLNLTEELEKHNKAVDKEQSSMPILIKVPPKPVKPWYKWGGTRKHKKSKQYE